MDKDLLHLPQALTSLQFIGHNDYFADIWRNGDGVKLHTWSEDKIIYRTVADFGCDDWEWLLAAHSLHSNDISNVRWA